jgi:hypothetical protein
MISFDSQLRQLVEEWRDKLSDKDIIAALEAEIESLRDLRAVDD